RDAKLLATLLQVSNQISKIITSAPPFEVTQAMQKNISNYAAIILLSTKISAYRGAVPLNTLLKIIKKNRFGIPVGLENDVAEWNKVITASQEALTQLRSKLKKLVFGCEFEDQQNDKIQARSEDHQNIFKLTQIFVDGTQCSVSVELCARIALMRQIYLEEAGSQFWAKVDVALAAIRTEGNGDAKRVARAFRHILKTDQQLHGANDDYEIAEEDAEDVQKEVDD
ncbi:hypothetical protein C8R43DRAFT_832669, partial [Mycena crocata]